MPLQMCPQQFATDGFLLARKLVAAAQLRTINQVMRARAAQVMEALGSKPIGIGSRQGYHELVQRSPGRFDVPMSEQDLAPIWGGQGSTAADVPWMDQIRAVLGAAAAPSFCGVVFSRPGSPAQQWHIDSPHEAADMRPAHAVNVLLALADIPLIAGPTEVARGSQLLTNHLERPWLNHDDLVYQTETEITPDLLCRDKSPARAEPQQPGVQAMSAGDCLIFDDRILHRGLANTSAQVRWVAYFSYMRPRPGLEQIADTHFEATRSLFAINGISFD